jgi:hypothetical protein
MLNVHPDVTALDIASPQQQLHDAIPAFGLVFVQMRGMLLYARQRLILG